MRVSLVNPRTLRASFAAQFVSPSFSNRSSRSFSSRAFEVARSFSSTISAVLRQSWWPRGLRSLALAPAHSRMTACQEIHCFPVVSGFAWTMMSTTLPGDGSPSSILI